MFLSVEMGEYRCSNAVSRSGNDERICALKDSQEAQSKAPVRVTVDFGDGSGEQLWTREDPSNLWVHQYHLPGQYWVHVSSRLHM